MVICEGEIPGQGGENGNLVRPEFSFEGGSKMEKKEYLKYSKPSFVFLLCIYSI